MVVNEARREPQRSIDVMNLPVGRATWHRIAADEGRLPIVGSPWKVRRPPLPHACRIFRLSVTIEGWRQVMASPPRSVIGRMRLRHLPCVSFREPDRRLRRCTAPAGLRRIRHRRLQSRCRWRIHLPRARRIRPRHESLRGVGPRDAFEP